MESEELRKLWETSYARHRELEAKYRATGTLTRQECDELRHCTARMGIVARESWLQAGKPDDPIFDALREPIRLSPLPASMRPLNLPGDREVH